MIDGIIGKKLGMTSLFGPEGVLIQVTAIEAGPCVVMQVKDLKSDKYKAVQLGFDNKKQARVKKPEIGHAKKARTLPKKIMREFMIKDEDQEAYEIGQTIRVEQVFAPGEKLDAIGISIGKGFAGVMKKYHFKGAKGSHGTHEYFRHGGSVGSSAYPSRVLKGMRMPGQMGNVRVTIQNLEIVKVQPEQNLILVKGGVPGHQNGYLLLQKAKKWQGMKRRKKKMPSNQ